MAGIIIWHIEMDVVVKSHYIISKSCSHWNTLEKWTLPYKIHKVGHCDLVQELVRAIHPRCLQTRYGLCKFYRLDLSTQSLRKDGRKDGWMPDNGWSHKLSMSLQLISWAKNQASNPTRNENIWKNAWNTCNPMAAILTSCDLYVGHSDLQTCMLVDPKEANNYIAETSWLLASIGFVP